jgi:hypothetical protein
MNLALPIAALLMLASCASTQYIEKGTQEGIEIAYRWNHPPGKPSELLLRLKNTAGFDQRVSVGLDLYYQGRTVETLEADTCMRAGQLLMGKLNGFYFVPLRLTTEQIKDGGAAVETTRFNATAEPCP